ncbi:hypothetical protein SYNPS1DRAFT_30791 [Syncephalis pseudoplumigaleata]|uniref:ATPase dynein-related AAA domain-containing protein n=1 Tax=Syncephalis pseudoplumigaleata TaxID=1712513 RepID=A0A4P9YW31_9FUNG|nr:hypothetical protein SYNPS1DRAFT_30791 [Syncephalis pseudoplumigaleata]|eukprot:RKP23461.1 hypothetical protein SYNPS1DRAFT_30791 [Syncephalis pseudoplumigaleata]
MAVPDIAMSDAAAASADAGTHAPPKQFNPLELDVAGAIAAFIDHDLPTQLRDTEADDAADRPLQLLADLAACRDELSAQAPPCSEDAHSRPHEQARPELCQRILRTLSELLLHPATTRLVARRFRPLLVDLVARWIWQLSARGGQVNAAAMTADGSTARLNRTEMALIAFSTLLPVAPQVKSLALDYFQLAPSPLDRLANFAALDDKKTVDSLYLLLRASYRLLSSTAKGIAASNFKGLFDWSPMHAAIDHANERISYLARYCLSFTLDMSDAERQRLLSGYTHPDDLSVAMHAIDDEVDIQEDLALAAYTSTSSPLLSDADLCPLVCNVCGVLMPRSDIVSSSSSPSSNEPPRLVLTAITRQQLHHTALAVSVGAPVLLQGPTGAGKTALVEALAQFTGRRQVKRADDLIKVHIGDQTDSKILLGTYVATAEPGHFRWQPGVLTTAWAESTCDKSGRGWMEQKLRESA